MMQEKESAMREILFKARRVDNGEWVEGYYLRYGHTSDEKSYIIPTYASALYHSEIDPATLLQYTGLSDKNGVKIWEGDICKDSLGWEFKVQWDNENARFLGRHDKPRGDTYICYVGRIPAVEVIGSIHDKEATL